MSNFDELRKNYCKYLFTKQNRDMTPPVFFHEKAIAFCGKNKKKFLSDEHIQAIYAVLVAWGMNRAGKKGAKMPTYNRFKESILRNRFCIETLKDKSITTISEDDLKKILPCLTCLCFNIEATTRSSRIVSGSKTLAHILPDLVCPIDNRYTLTFFQKEFAKKESEESKFQHIIKKMWEFYQDEEIKKNIQTDGVFAHSLPKIFDNLIISYRQEQIENELTNLKSTKSKL